MSDSDVKKISSDDDDAIAITTDDSTDVPDDMNEDEVNQMVQEALQRARRAMMSESRNYSTWRNLSESSKSEHFSFDGSSSGGRLTPVLSSHQSDYGSSSGGRLTPVLSSSQSDYSHISEYYHVAAAAQEESRLIAAELEAVSGDEASSTSRDYKGFTGEGKDSFGQNEKDSHDKDEWYENAHYNSNHIVSDESVSESGSDSEGSGSDSSSTDTDTSSTSDIFLASEISSEDSNINYMALGDNNEDNAYLLPQFSADDDTGLKYVPVTNDMTHFGSEVFDHSSQWISSENTEQKALLELQNYEKDCSDDGKIMSVGKDHQPFGPLEKSGTVHISAISDLGTQEEVRDDDDHDFYGKQEILEENNDFQADMTSFSDDNDKAQTDFFKREDIEEMDTKNKFGQVVEEIRNMLKKEESQSFEGVSESTVPPTNNDESKIYFQDGPYIHSLEETDFLHPGLGETDKNDIATFSDTKEVDDGDIYADVKEELTQTNDDDVNIEEKRMNTKNGFKHVVKEIRNILKQDEKNVIDVSLSKEIADTSEDIGNVRGVDADACTSPGSEADYLDEIEAAGRLAFSNDVSNDTFVSKNAVVDTEDEADNQVEEGNNLEEMSEVCTPEVEDEVSCKKREEVSRFQKETDAISLGISDHLNDIHFLNQLDVSEESEDSNEFSDEISEETPIIENLSKSNDQYDEDSIHETGFFDHPCREESFQQFSIEIPTAANGIKNKDSMDELLFPPRNSIVKSVEENNRWHTSNENELVDDDEGKLHSSESKAQRHKEHMSISMEADSQKGCIDKDSPHDEEEHPEVESCDDVNRFEEGMIFGGDSNSMNNQEDARNYQDSKLRSDPEQEEIDNLFSYQAFSQDNCFQDIAIQFKSTNDVDSQKSEVSLRQKFQLNMNDDLFSNVEFMNGTFTESQKAKDSVQDEATSDDKKHNDHGGIQLQWKSPNSVEEVGMMNMNLIVNEIESLQKAFDSDFVVGENVDLKDLSDFSQGKSIKANASNDLIPIFSGKDEDANLNWSDYNPRDTLSEMEGSVFDASGPTNSEDPSLACKKKELKGSDAYGFREDRVVDLIPPEGDLNDTEEQLHSDDEIKMINKNHNSKMPTDECEESFVEDSRDEKIPGSPTDVVEEELHEYGEEFSGIEIEIIPSGDMENTEETEEDTREINKFPIMSESTEEVFSKVDHYHIDESLVRRDEMKKETKSFDDLISTDGSSVHYLDKYAVRDSEITIIRSASQNICGEEKSLLQKDISQVIDSFIKIATLTAVENVSVLILYENYNSDDAIIDKYAVMHQGECDERNQDDYVYESDESLSQEKQGDSAEAMDNQTRNLNLSSSNLDVIEQATSHAEDFNVLDGRHSVNDLNSPALLQNENLEPQNDEFSEYSDESQSSTSIRTSDGYDSFQKSLQNEYEEEGKIRVLPPRNNEYENEQSSLSEGQVSLEGSNEEEEEVSTTSESQISMAEGTHEEDDEQSSASESQISTAEKSNEKDEHSITSDDRIYTAVNFALKELTFPSEEERSECSIGTMSDKKSLSSESAKEDRGFDTESDESVQQSFPSNNLLYTSETDESLYTEETISLAESEDSRDDNQGSIFERSLQHVENVACNTAPSCLVPTPDMILDSTFSEYTTATFSDDETEELTVTLEDITCRAVPSASMWLEAKSGTSEAMDRLKKIVISRF